MANLNTKAWLGLLFLFLVMAAILFVLAGTIRYWQGWVYLAVFFGVSVPITVYLMRRDRALLARRLRSGPVAEKETSQKIIMAATSLGFIGLIAIPALDRRFGWSNVPLATVILGDILVAAGFFFVFLVYRVNSFTSATIEVSEDQTVVTTGPYAYVRHPMYAGSFWLLLGTPLALGSYWGLLALVAIGPFLLWRLLDEERFLKENLPGYMEYCAKVRWRLVPCIF